jgi:diguanylate cyclase (GGDEF)-like protein/putative nucleotidyltransferase with HDIG domain/PAS domain S-box-containing protein
MRLPRLRGRTAREDALDVHAMFNRILGAIDEYVYVGEILPDDGYRLIFQGPCREQFLGMTVEEARDAVWSEFVHPDDLEHFNELHRCATVDGALDGQYRLIGADGVIRWVRDRGRIRHEGGRVFLDGSALDVTVVHEAQEALERARAEADRQGRIDPLTGVANRRALPEMLDRRLGASKPGVGVLLLDIDRFKQINDRHGHAAGDAVLVAVADRVRRALRTGDAVARIGGEEFLVMLPGMQDEAALRRVGELVRLAIRSEPVDTDRGPLTVTVSVGGALSGVTLALRDVLIGAADRALYAAKHRGRDQVVLVSDLSEGEETEVASEELRLAHALALSTWAREGVTEAHADEVGRLAASVARRAGAPPAVVARCRLAGLLHDIGKAAIPDAILLKPGALDDEEWALMRTHPDRGAELVDRVPELREAAGAVRHHHERWDGAGYPGGMAGERIPFEARVIAVVDAYSAMTSDRPYRRGRSQADARAELARVAGSHLDPALVAALLAVLDAERSTAPTSVLSA